MVKRIESSEKDRTALGKLLLNRKVVESSQPKDYRNKVVVKPWGYEFLIFENEYVAVWFLHIRKGHSTSMHCHPVKKTSLIVLTGSALCNTFEHRNYLNDMQGVIIDPGVFHSTQSLSADGINLIEVETPPNKTDLVRLNDEYGRESRGYEGHSEMQSEGLERFGFFCLDAPQTGPAPAHRTPHFSISLETVCRGSKAAEWLIPESHAYYCVCQGQLAGADGKVILQAGDAESGDVLGALGAGSREPDDPLLLLKATKI